MFPYSKMTVLGDLNQAIYLHSSAGIVDFQRLTSDQNVETETIILNKSYRSTRPIIEFTRQMIDDGEQIEAFNRNGNKPTIEIVNDKSVLYQNIFQRVGMLQEQGSQTTAIICKTQEESFEAYESLKDKLEINYITRETSSFKTGIFVLPSYLAKGLEFDAVILFDASKDRYSKESERKLFYTACTRAMHELYIYSLGEISPFISSVSTDSYILSNQ